MDANDLLHRRRSRGRKCGRQCQKFKTVAKRCHRLLREGGLPNKSGSGSFKACMRSGL